MNEILIIQAGGEIEIEFKFDPHIIKKILHSEFCILN